MPTFTKTLDSKYDLFNFSGKGGFGFVWQVKAKDSEQCFAIKQISAEGRNFASAVRELTVIRSIDHPNLLRYVDHEFTEYGQLFIVTKFVHGGDLLKRINNLREQNGYMDERTCKFIFRQIVAAVNYLHNKDLIHRDIKPNNILLSDDSDRPLVKVANFGLSRSVDPSMASSCGTEPYAAPEVLLSLNKIPYTEKADVWSLGATLHTMVANIWPPRDDKDPSTVMFSAAARNSLSLPLIQLMLQADPTARPSCADILMDPWLKDAALPEAAKPARPKAAQPLPPHRTMPVKR